MRKRVVALIVYTACLALSSGPASVAIATPIPVYPIDPSTDVAAPPGPGQWRG